jgi:hypothetical protein
MLLLGLSSELVLPMFRVQNLDGRGNMRVGPLQQGYVLVIDKELGLCLGATGRLYPDVVLK